MNIFLEKIKKTVAAYNGQLHGKEEIIFITNIFEFSINGKQFMILPLGFTGCTWTLKKEIGGRFYEICETSFDNIISKKIPLYA
jgi:acetate kinase